jgi:hypothetical protein
MFRNPFPTNLEPDPASSDEPESRPSEPKRARRGATHGLAVVARVVVSLVGLTLAGFGGAFATEHAFPGLFGSSPAADVTTVVTPASCGQASVAVGYDLRYSPSLASFAVDAVHVVGLDPACDGATISIELANTDGAVLDGATASGTVTGGTVRMALSADVPAADVGRIAVAIAGQTQIVTQPTIPAPTEPTTTAPASPSIQIAEIGVTPSLCDTVTGMVSAEGKPANCGSVAAPVSATPTGGTGGTTPAPAAAVVSWTAGTFDQPVTVSFQRPVQSTVPQVTLGAGTFVQLNITDASGAAITQFTGALAIDFPSQLGSFAPLYSEDGTTWRTVPQLDTPDLPAGQPDGYYRHADGSITVFTRHASVWALVKPPTTVGGVHATALADGNVRVSWHAATAGLGIKGYQVFRDNHLVATVRTTRTTVGLHGLHVATFKVRAIDQAGTLGRLSAIARVRARVVTHVGGTVAQASVVRGSAAVVLRAQLGLDAPSAVTISVLTASGQRVPLLPGSRVGLRVQRTTVQRLRTTTHAGHVPLVLRLPTAAVRTGDVYRLWITGLTAGRKPTPLVYVFDGP